jgi:SAM-dependent methyltransferase
MPRLAARLLVGLHRYFPRFSRPLYNETGYAAWLEGCADLLYTSFYERHVSFAGKRVLDVACGIGGKAVRYAKAGSESVFGIDISLSSLVTATSRKALNPALDIRYTAADAAFLPFRHGSFDVVVSDDGFDHFFEPEKVLAEMMRVTAPGGHVFVSFVPYYSRNCSHLGYSLSVPWVHVLFSQAAILDALDEIEGRHGAPPHGAGETVPVLNSLSRLDVRRFRRLLEGLQDTRLVRVRLNASRWVRPFCYVPWVREFVTDGIFCVLSKQAGTTIRPADFRRQAMRDLRRLIGRTPSAGLGTQAP